MLASSSSRVLWLLVLRVIVEAAPISPSDLGSVGMLARFGADSIAVGEAAFTVTVPFPQALEGMFKADGDMKLVGNEGAGVVVAAGSAPEAQDHLGKRVAVTGGSSYAQYTKTSLNNPMFAVLLDDVSSLEGASVFRESPDSAWFHSHQQSRKVTKPSCAAASQLGRMLVKQCKGEGIPLVKHRVNRTGKCRGIQRRVYRQRTGNDVGAQQLVSIAMVVLLWCVHRFMWYASRPWCF